MAKKAREPRQVTATPARLNSDGRWQDVCIRNISSRGMMVEAQNPPPRGHYLEVRKGGHVIVGRVVWATGYHVGIVTQDRLEVSAVLAEAKVPPRRRTLDGEPIERRRAPRREERHERSRVIGRFIDSGSFLVLGATGAVLAMDMARAAFERPLHEVESVLVGGAANAESSDISE
jgi:hypothetical protein